VSNSLGSPTQQGIIFSSTKDVMQDVLDADSDADILTISFIHSATSAPIDMNTPLNYQGLSMEVPILVVSK
jgi:hypothetical protein